MGAHEITMVTEQYRGRIAELLTPEEIAQYDLYEQRLMSMLSANESSSAEPTPAEQAVLDKIAMDERAAALHKQLMVLLRIETLPQ
ncbi:MAG TPA: hypothetical protein VFU22_03100 [Roseiflexaceae bacterium]|nr:hypothetical protein [Roseiflexaceae bacterium]